MLRCISTIQTVEADSNSQDDKFNCVAKCYIH
jgi:hypothetical protein